METFKSLLDLFWTFAKIGAVTFGGGIAMLPILERELADKRHWTTGEELLDYYAISQSTPGVIAVNVSTFIGYKRKGIAGGIVATAGVVTPSIIIITIIALCLSNFADIPVVQKALVGINVAVASLLTYAVVSFVKKTLKGVFAGIMLVAGFTAIYFFHISRSSKPSPFNIGIIVRAALSRAISIIPNCGILWIILARPCCS